MSNRRPDRQDVGSPPSPPLVRELDLKLLTLYGLGITIGAGIYVLIGATAAKAGLYAPVSFLIAAIAVGLTGLSYAELGTRFPVAAGAAAYVLRSFGSRPLSLTVGLLVAFSGIVSAAAITLGAAAYLRHFLPLPEAVLIVLLLVALGAAAIRGIVFSVTVAGIMTLIEIGGLLLVIVYAAASKPALLADLPLLVPPLEAVAWSGILAAGLLAFFAFVGFEDIANVAEEVKDPVRTMPRAILLTLGIATTLYLLVAAIVVLAVPMDRLIVAKAPLALLFEGAGPGLETLFALIACIATINGILVQIIMAPRVLYGLAMQGSLPPFFAYVHPELRTPVNSTLLVVGCVLALALFLPIGRLAEAASMIVLFVFTLVNLALVRLKFSPTAAGEPAAYSVPKAVPVLGFATCLVMIAAGLLA